MSWKVWWIGELVNCWIGELVNWWIGEVVNWWIGELVNWWIGELVNWWIGEVVKWWIGELVNWWIGELVNGWIGAVKSKTEEGSASDYQAILFKFRFALLATIVFQENYLRMRFRIFLGFALHCSWFMFYTAVKSKTEEGSASDS